MAWTFPTLVTHLDSLQEHRAAYGLARMTAMCARLGHPERAVPCVHIAGTNGKGSTLAFLAALLRTAGYRVGTYTSPHLQHVSERIRVDGAAMPEDRLAAHGERIVQSQHDTALTWFEFVTLLAFCNFAEARPDIVLLETGLGGRLDATNVVTPAVAVLTPIALDHQQWLGATLPEIAREKCGIIKPGRPVVTGTQDDTVMAVIRNAAQTGGCALHCAAPAPDDWPLGLAGAHQRTNAGTAWHTAQVLSEHGWRAPDPSALAHARWPGRCEWISQIPPICFDGAHNPHAARVLAAYLAEIRNHRQVICVIGVLDDKDAPGIIAPLLPLVHHWVTVTPPGPRGLANTALAELLHARGAAATPCPIGHAMQHLRILPDGWMGVVTGSLSLYAAVTESASPPS